MKLEISYYFTCHLYLDKAKNELKSKSEKIKLFPKNTASQNKHQVFIETRKYPPTNKIKFKTCAIQ